jgi:hypothetical protein
VTSDQWVDLAKEIPTLVLALAMLRYLSMGFDRLTDEIAGFRSDLGRWQDRLLDILRDEISRDDEPPTENGPTQEPLPLRRQ